MFLDDDLKIWAAYKRIGMLWIPLYLIWVSGFIAYVWTTAFPLFTIPLSLLLGPLPITSSSLLWFPDIEFHLLTINIKSPLLFNSSPLILFKINPTLELLLLAITFGCLPPIIVIGTYLLLLLRLSKDTTFGNLMFTIRTWKLPDSKRYKNYGETKTRIKQLIKTGTLKEKTAIFALSASYLGLISCIIIYLLSLSGILPAILWHSGGLILLPFLLIMLASQRFMWNTIQ
nr:hypothetical protein [Candidatus Freyarchaeota archaeon]